MNTPLPLDAAKTDRLAALVNGAYHLSAGECLALIAQSRAALTLAARVAEQDAEALRYYAADGSFVVMESREAVVAARIEAARRMAELERERDEARENAKAWESEADSANALGQSWMAHANALREALEKADAMIRKLLSGAITDTGAGEVGAAIGHALSAHPAASLAAYRKSVLEEAATAAESYLWNLHAIQSQVGANCGDAIRALAAQEVKP